MCGCVEYESDGEAVCGGGGNTYVGGGGEVEE